MRHFFIISLFFVFIATVHGNDTTAIMRKAELEFKNGNILEGKILLESLLDEDSLSDEENAVVHNKIAWFYEELVGDYQFAERYSKKVLGFSLPPSHATATEANDRIGRLKRNAIKFREQNKAIRQMQMEASDRTDAEKKIRELKQFIINNPEYPDLHVAYHYIGKNYLYLENYYESCKVFSDLLEKRPGIIFLLPTESMMEQAKSMWHFSLANLISKSVIAGVLIILSVLLVLSKFWEWMNLKSLAGLPAVVILWALFLMCCSWILNYFIPDQKNDLLALPAFIQSIPFEPGSEILITVFFYGTLGIICSFLFALATYRFKRPGIRLIVNGSVLMLFMASVFTVFYLNHCHNRTIFAPRADSSFPHITGHIYFQAQDFEPLVLTNPRKYPDLDMNNTTDEHFRNWVVRQYAIIAKESEKNASTKMD